LTSLPDIISLQIMSHNAPGDGISPYLDVQTSSTIAHVHHYLVPPKSPAFEALPEPLAPRQWLVSCSGWHPHCNSQNLIRAFLLGNME
jgi:hypothetical protein